MEENIDTQETSQQTTEQIYEEKPKGLLPGQEHEDELDLMGAVLFGFVSKGFNWIKNLFQQKK